MFYLNYFYLITRLPNLISRHLFICFFVINCVLSYTTQTYNVFLFFFCRIICASNALKKLFYFTLRIKQITYYLNKALMLNDKLRLILNNYNTR